MSTNGLGKHNYNTPNNILISYSNKGLYGKNLK